MSAAVPQRHPNPGSSNHATLAAVNKILNGSSLSGIATSLSAAVTNLSSAHNTLVNNHAGMHSSQARLVQARPMSQQQTPTHTVNSVNTVNTTNNANSANTVEVNLVKSLSNQGSQPRVNEQQINDLIKSALQKGLLRFLMFTWFTCKRRPLSTNKTTIPRFVSKFWLEIIPRIFRRLR